jgi:hypothetical protein
MKETTMDDKYIAMWHIIWGYIWIMDAYAL